MMYNTVNTKHKKETNMTVEYYSIPSKSGYLIPCKLFSSGGECQKIIIGIHGFGGSKESFALTLLAEKMPAGCKLLAFDLPAHGKGAEDCYLRLDNCINDLLTVCAEAERLCPQGKRFIFATSFGGYIWLNAERLLNGSISKVVLRVPAVEMAKTLSSKLIDTDPEEFKKRGFAVCGYERKIKVSYDFYEELSENDVTLVSPALPTLMICGDKDELVDYSAQKAFADRNSGSVRLITLKNAGHRFLGDGELETAISAALEFFCPGTQK